jgi:hypothetical protein
MPTANVNLVETPADRLRPLLDAFAIQLHYNLHTNKIKIQATVSANTVPHLAETAETAETANSGQPAHTPVPVARSRPPAVAGTDSARGRQLAVTATYSLGREDPMAPNRTASDAS